MILQWQDEEWKGTGQRGWRKPVQTPVRKDTRTHRRAQPRAHDCSCEPYSEPSAKKPHLPAQQKCTASIKKKKKLILQLLQSHITGSKFGTNSASAPNRTTKSGGKHSQLRILEASNTKKKKHIPVITISHYSI